MFDLRSDVRLAVRRIGRAPLLALTASLTLALGIGAATAIYAVLEPVFLSPLPYPEPNRIVMLWEREKEGETSRVGYSTFSDLRAATSSFTALSAFTGWQPTFVNDGDAERVRGVRVTHEFFRALGIRPALGRDFEASEDRPESNSVVLLSHALWQRRFGGDSNVVGRTMRLSDREHQVIGVLPADFENVLVPGAEVIAPLGYADTLGWACRTCRHLRVVGRLKHDVTQRAVDAELASVFTRMKEQYATAYASVGVAAITLRDNLTADVRAPLYAIAGAVCLLLLIALANVTNLFIARTMQRESELTIRTALGAGRWRLVRELAVEAVIIGAVGGLIGVAIAQGGMRALLALAPAAVPRLDKVQIDASVVLVAFGLAVLLGLLSGVLPGWMARARDGERPLHLGTRTVARGARHRMRQGLVVTEFALALMLLTGAGLLVRSVQHLLGVDGGFATINRTTLSLSLTGPRYNEQGASTQGWRAVLESVRSVPGVEDVALTSQLPLSGDWDEWSIHQEAAPRPNPADDPSAYRFAVSGDYFQLMDIKLLRGRLVTDADDERAPLSVVVNETIAKRDFAGRDPLGQRVKMGGMDGPWRTVVGVVSDVKHRGLDAQDEGQIYLTFSQNSYEESFLRLLVRSSLDQQSLRTSIRDAVRRVDPSIPISDVLSLEGVVESSSIQRRFAQRLFQCFAAIALLLAGVGIYGVLAAMVGERTREIGIRSALGATRERIIALVLRQGLRMAAVGIGVGLVGAVWLAGALRVLLFGVAPRDPLTLGVVALSLALLAIVAAFVPAWRATRVEAIEALRAE